MQQEETLTMPKESAKPAKNKDSKQRRAIKKMLLEDPEFQELLEELFGPVHDPDLQL